MGCYWACPYQVIMFRFCPENAKFYEVDFFDDEDGRIKVKEFRDRYEGLTDEEENTEEP